MSAKEFKVVSVRGEQVVKYNWSGSRLKSLDTSVLEREIAPYLEQGWEMAWVLPIAYGTLDAVLVFLERPKQAAD